MAGKGLILDGLDPEFILDRTLALLVYIQHKDKGKETQTSYSNPATGGPVPYAASLDPSIAAPTNGAYVPQPSSSTPESEGKRLVSSNISLLLNVVLHTYVSFLRHSDMYE